MATATLAILLDRSRSMGEGIPGTGLTRFAAAKKVAAKAVSKAFRFLALTVSTSTLRRAVF